MKWVPFLLGVIIGAAFLVGRYVGFERGWVAARCEYTREGVQTASDSVRYLQSGCVL